MSVQSHAEAIKELVDTAVADDDLSRDELREVLDEVESHIEGIRNGLNVDDKTDGLR